MKTTYKEKTKAKRPKPDAPDSEKASTSKRRRPSQPKPAATPTVPQPKKIACVGCGQADVPLMLGGRTSSGSFSCDVWPRHISRVRVCRLLQNLCRHGKTKAAGILYLSFCGAFTFLHVTRHTTTNDESL